MHITTVLLHPLMLRALLVYVLSMVVLVFIAGRVEDKLTGTPMGFWWTYIMAPLLRAALLLCFLLLAYPVVFGLTRAPPVSGLLSYHRITTVLNTMYVATLVLHWMPFVAARVALVLPVQALLAAGILLNWMAQAMGVENYDLWPGGAVTWAVLNWAVLAHPAAVFCSKGLGTVIDKTFNLEGAAQLVYHSFAMLWQIPMVLIYTLALGRQFQAIAT